MTIANGQTADANDFVSSASGSSDSGKVAKLDATGNINPGFTKFGGDGSDGALTVSSGTTNIDLGSAAVVVKNYTSISITGTGAVTFSNPHSAGTVIIFKCKGNCVITSSATRAIDARNLGSSGGTTSVSLPGSSGTTPTGHFIFSTASQLAPSGNGGSENGVAGGGGGSLASTFYTSTANKIHLTGGIFLIAGAGGGGGGSNTSGSTAGGNGGRGGGSLLIQCGGDLNFTGTIDSSGQNGSDGAAASGAAAGNGGGGGGGAGQVIILYNSATATSGTITAAGGNGGSSGTGAGATGEGGGGGGGGGTLFGAGASGGAEDNVGANASASTGAGGGGGGGRDGAGAGYAGGNGGSSAGGLVLQNVWFQ